MNITPKLVAIAKKMDARFTLKGRSLVHEEVFSDTGLLPGMTKRADQLASLCFGYGLGATYEDAEPSLMGKRVKFDDFTPDVLRLLCITDVLHELMKASPTKTDIPLDEIMYD